MSLKPETKDRAGVIAPPPLIYAGIFLIGYLFQRAYPLPLFPEPFNSFLGASLIIVSLLLAISGMWALKRAGTHIDPFKPTTVLVVDGPYRFSRNPLYLSLTFLYTGIAVLFNLCGPILILPLALILMQFGVVIREERYLEKKFGEDYRLYRAHVRRWI